MSDETQIDTDAGLASELFGAMPITEKEGLNPEIDKSETPVVDRIVENEPKDEAEATEDSVDKIDDDKADAEAETKPDAPTGEDDETDYFEIAAEDGKTERLKVDEVYSGYQRAQELETELAELKANPAVSGQLQPDHEQVLQGLVQERTALSEAITRWQSQNPIPEPDVGLLDDNSDSYNPPEYQRQMANKLKLEEEHRQANAQLTAESEALQQQTQQLQQAHIAKEQAKLTEIWPEVMNDQTVRSDVMKGLTSNYKLDPETINSIHDHRFYAMAKDALAFRAQQAKTDKAIKVVRSKPKLVQGAARQSGKSEALDSAMNRLKKSGGTDERAAKDALDAVMQ